MPASASLRAAARGLARGLALAAAGGVVLAAGAWAAWPWTSAGLAAWLAPRLGLDVLEIESARPGWRGWSVSSARAATRAWEARLGRGHVAYRLSGLIDGRVTDVAWRNVDLTLRPAGAGDGRAAPHPSALFAALPADRLGIEHLTVRAPVQDFAATGAVDLAPRALQLSLTAERPEAVRGLRLDGRLAADGGFTVGLEAPEAGNGAAPRLDADGRLEADRMHVAGSLDLRAEPLAILTTLLGLPQGLESVSGHFEGDLPWPPWQGDVPASALLGGTLTGDWRSQHETADLTEVTANWRLDAATLHFDGSARLTVGSLVVPVRVDAGEWRLGQGGGQGRVWLGLDEVSPEAAGLSARWRVSADVAELDAEAHASAAGWQSLGRVLEWLPGRGAATVSAVATAPWPLPDGLRPAAVDAEGRVSGRWQDEDSGLALDDVAARWRWRDGVLAADADATVTVGQWRVPVAVAMDDVDPLARPLAVAGRWRLDGGPAQPVQVMVEDESVRLVGALEQRLRPGLLGAWAPDWRAPFAVSGGTVRARGSLAWTAAAGIGGTVALTLDEVAAAYGETELRGLWAELELLGESSGWRLSPSPVRVAVLDPGVPVSDLTATVGLRGARAEVSGAAARVLGGHVGAAPFAYDLETGSTRIDIAFEGVALDRVLALEGDDVTGTGTLRGTLPVIVSGHRPAISGGTVAADPPGGVIRVAPALAGGVGQPGLDFALRALQNFTYTGLDADVDYSADGDLVLGVRLRGRNPEIEGGRPIHYNLNVRENVPALLESLRLENRVTEGIERRMQN